jgi:hypothetical protein
MPLRQYFGLAGIVLALAGIALELRWLVWAAIGVLAASVAFRLVESARVRRASEAGEEGGPT